MRWERELSRLRGYEEPALKTNQNIAGLLQIRLGIAGFLLSSVFGCSHERCHCQPNLAQRVLPPPSSDQHEVVLSPRNAVQLTAGELPSPPSSLKQPEAIESGPAELPIRLPPCEGTSLVDQTLTLSDAIALAFRLQPRLRASLESIRQAQGRESIAFAAYLPTASAAYSVGGYDLTVGGTVPLPSAPRRSHSFLAPARFPLV